MAEVSRRPSSDDMDSKRKLKTCVYCDTKTTPLYTDTTGLRRFTSTRGKIVPKQRSGVCSKHQRGLAREVKHARHLALMPFVLKA